jgi:lipoprotein signal peptidase
MIHVLPQWDIFPYVFNVADSLLCVGVALMVLHSIITPHKIPSDSSRTAE